MVAYAPYAPFTLKADKSKPARVVQDPEGKLWLEYYDENGEVRRTPIVVTILPTEIRALKDQLDVTDLVAILPVCIVGQEVTVDVDTLGSELGVTGEIDTSSAISPVTALTPTSGKRIDVRGVYLATDSNAGEVWAYFADSGTLIGKIYCAVHTKVTLGLIHLTGDVDEPIKIAWSGLSTGAKIFYTVRYKEV